MGKSELLLLRLPLPKLEGRGSGEPSDGKMQSEFVEDECKCLLYEDLGGPVASDPDEKVGRSLDVKKDLDGSGLRESSMLSTTE